MNRKSLAYAGILLVTLVVASILLGKGMVQGVHNNADIKLTTDSNQYLLGQPIKWAGSLDFADGEEATVHQVRLVVDGSQPLNVSLPLQPGTHDLSSRPGVKGNLTAVVTYNNIQQFGGTIPPPGTLPGSTLPGGGQFKGVGAGAKIAYDITWIPPVFLDPAPEFTLIPDVDVLYPIPQIPGPPPQTGTVLPQTELKFSIPVIGAPTGTALPSSDHVFDIPQVTVTSTAPESLPDLPATTASFNIPSVSVDPAPTGVLKFPDSTNAFDIPQLTVDSAPAGVPNVPDTTRAFVMPDLVALGLVPTAPSGVNNLPDSSLAFSIPGDASPRGIASDGADFWMIIDGTPRDQLIKIDGQTGLQVGSAVDGPSANLQGLAYLNNSLWVGENQFRCFEDINGDSNIDENRCDRSHRIFKVNPASMPANDNDWAALFATSINAPELWAEVGGITHQGSGASGTLWVARKSGGRLFNIQQDGDEVESPFTSEFNDQMDAAAFHNGIIYTSKSGTITGWTTTGSKVGDTVTNPSRNNIRGMTFHTVSGQPVLFFASQSDKKVYKGFFATTVTQNPRGLGYSASGSTAGEAIWVLLDASPKDKIVKVNATTGAVISNFGSSGVSDAPSAGSEGITYLSNNLWVVANEGFVRKLYKLNPTTGATVSEYDLGSTAQIWDDLGDITHNGTNLVVYARDWNNAYIIDPSNGSRLEFKGVCCPPTLNGARGLAYHSGRSQYFFAKSAKLGNANSDLAFLQEQTIKKDSVNLTGSVQGLVFNGSLLYVAVDGEVLVGFLASSVTTNPTGIAYSPTGSTPGRALWVLVDGEPADKLLKINPDTGALDTTFDTDGAVDAPSNKTEGVTYLTNYLWIIANESFDRKLYKVNPSNGAVVESFALSSTAQVWSDIGDITNDGANLILWEKSSNSVFVIDPANGQRADAGQVFTCCPSFFGARGLAFHSGRNILYAANGGKVGSFDGTTFSFQEEVTMKAAGSNISGLQGLAFEGNVMYSARTGSPGKIGKSFLATTVTTVPRGIEITPASVGKALWILVDGEPKDKLLKVDPATGLLITSFGTNGAVDAPSKNTEGLAYLNNNLWIVANDGFDRRLYKINLSTGAVADTFNLNLLNVWGDLGDIASNGTNLVAYDKLNNTFWVFDANITTAEQRWVGGCCPSFNGAKALSYHSSRGQYFAARNAKLGTFDAEYNFLKEQTVTEDSNSISNIEGIAFDGDVLYVARDQGGTGKVSSGALRTAVTTLPRGIAFIPDGTVVQGTPVGPAFYVLVDGDPKDKILKLDQTTGALVDTFGTGGAVDAPSARAEGITFLGTNLWVIANDPDAQKLYKIKPTDGSVLNTYKLSGNPGSNNIWQQLGGLTTNGSNLMAFAKDSNELFIINTNGEMVEQKFTCCTPTNGANGLAFRMGKQQLFAAKNDRIIQYAVIEDKVFSADEFGPVVTGIQGMTFVSDILYIAHGTTAGKVAKAAIPSDITNFPRGLAYDAGASELYILVDGKAQDHIIVVNPTTGAQIRDYPVAGFKETHGITFLNNHLYVAAEGEGQFGPPPRKILKLNPANGNKVNDFDVSFLPGKVMSVDNDGTMLIVTTEFGGSHVEFLNPSSGNSERSVFFFDPANPFNQMPEGFEGLAYRGGVEPEYFPMKGKTVFRMDSTGRKIQDFVVATADFDSIQGAVFVGDMLYMAESSSAGGRTIHGALIPVPPTVITKDPRGMATDGTNLYIAVDGSPKDKIMKLNAQTGALVTAFGNAGAMDSPGTETGGLAYHGGHLYAVINDEKSFPNPFGGPPFIERRAFIYKIDPATGTQLDRFEVLMQDAFGPPHPVFEALTALASDGSFLYAGVKGDQGMAGVWLKINPANPNSPAPVVNEFAGKFPFMPGFEAMEITQGNMFAGRELVASGSIGGPGNANVIARFDRETGVMHDQFNLGARDVRGLAYIGLTLYMADNVSDMILSTSLPENTIELTIVGSYHSELRVDVSPSVGVFNTWVSPDAAYAIIRNPQVLVQVTSPANNAVITTANATISGRLNDPAIAEVMVGIRLPFTVLVDDQAVPGLSGNLWSNDSSQGNGANWHISCTDSFPPTRVNSPTCSWRYSVPGGPNFTTGGRTSGTLTTVTPIEVNPGTKMEFFTGYLTELFADRDQKIVEVAEVTQDIQGNDVVGGFKPILQIVGRGGGAAPPPAQAHPSFHYVELDPLFLQPNLVPVHADLSPFSGKRVMVRFRFDSVDAFANEGEGWYLDDIRISGEGFKTITVPTTLLTTPQVAGNVKYWRTFSTPFTLAEGENEVGAGGFQPYSPFLFNGTLIHVFVDQTEPVVELFGLPQATKNLLQTLQGRVKDATFQSLSITQNGQLIFTLSSMPQNGEFSIPVSLIEGLNTFEAVATDGGGLQNDPPASLQTIGDVTAPTASVKVVTIASEGEAVVGDEFFLVVAAKDNLSGIADVVHVSSGQSLAPVADVPSILMEEHGLVMVGADATTHVRLASVQSGTPVGVNSIAVRIVDGAGNQSTVNGQLNVVSARSNRNFFLFPGVNFVGLALIPDDGDPNTSDDASLDRLMSQVVTGSVNPAYASALGRPVTLGDVIESTFAYSDAGTFVSHIPDTGVTDTLTQLAPFQGMTMRTRETATVGGSNVNVFKKVSVAGFTAQQSVPIRMNVKGVFFRPGELPPDKVLRVGYNLVAPHILTDTLFDTVYRGALIPKQLAVSAITFERSVFAFSVSSGIAAEVFEGFVTQSLGGFLKPELSYWTYIAQDAPTVGASTRPTITP
jgi:uncharacterized protein YjiK